MKKYDLILKNACLTDDVETDIAISDGVIAAMGMVDGDADRVIDCHGAYVMPAFVDMHTHLREPGYEYKEDIASGCAAAVKGGYGAVCCMPNTNPPIDNVPVVHYIISRAQEVGLCKVYPIGCITKGQQSRQLADMRRMHDAGAIAFSDDGRPVESAGLMRNAMAYAKDYLLISHSEDLSLSDGGAANEGENAAKVGIRGIPHAAEEVGIARELVLAASEGTRIHIAHVSTKGSVDIIRAAKKLGVKVTAETCPHYFSATDNEIIGFNTNAKINPPLRTEDDVAAVIEGLKDGTIDVIATDHAPHHIDDKNKEFQAAAFGTVGLESAYALAVTKLVEPGYLTLSDVERLMSRRPAEILNLEAFGKIEVGAAANLTVADNRETFVFDKTKMASKARNTLFDGWALRGKIKYTITDGKVKYEEINHD